MIWKHSYQTDIGRVRNHNEDAVGIFERDQLLVMVVADGMGGHASGDVASQMAIEFIQNEFNNGLIVDSKEAARDWMTHVLEQVNADILAYAKANDVLLMGTTLVIVVVTETFIAIANIGDSRAYLFAFDKLRQLTKDHTFVRELVDKGQISEHAAKSHPQKNIISKALGASENLEFDFFTLEHYDASGILLCTDGLTGLVEDQSILTVLKSDMSTREKVQQLVEKANDQGGWDNISIALLEFREGSAPE